MTSISALWASQWASESMTLGTEEVWSSGKIRTLKLEPPAPDWQPLALAATISPPLTPMTNITNGSQHFFLLPRPQEGVTLCTAAPEAANTTGKDLAWCWGTFRNACIFTWLLRNGERHTFYPTLIFSPPAKEDNTAANLMHWTDIQTIQCHLSPSGYICLITILSNLEVNGKALQSSTHPLFPASGFTLGWETSNLCIDFLLAPSIPLPQRTTRSVCIILLGKIYLGSFSCLCWLSNQTFVQDVTQSSG